MMNSFNRQFLLSCLALLPFAGSGQSVVQWTTWGDAAFERGEFYGASRFYAGALETDPGRMSLQWKQAEALRLSNQYDKAAALYDRVYHKDQGRTHANALRWLGEMQLCSGQYEEAERTWNKDLQKEKDKGSFTALRAKNALEGCRLATASNGESDSLIIEHLPQPVNTYDSEFGARIGPDSALYFTSLRGKLNADDEVKDTATYYTALFKVKETGNNWALPSEDPQTANEQVDIANIAWNATAEWMLFSKCSSSVGCHIQVQRTNDLGNAISLPGLDSVHTTTQPMVVQVDGKEWLYFVSDAPGGEGEMDIWIAEFKDGAAARPRPLGKPVNTPGNERSPWYERHSNTLYFSSDFLPGLGGFDVFTAQRSADGNFAHPVNAGKPINSPANDLYASYNPVRNEGWLTSNRIGSFAAKGETCCNDLYRFRLNEPPIVDVAPVIAKVDSLPPLGSTPTETQQSTIAQLQADFPLVLYFHNDEPEPRSWKLKTDKTYNTTYDQYAALRPLYEKENSDPRAFDAFFNDEVQRGHTQLQNLAQALIPVLKSGQQITLEVRGHASPLARNDYNKNLSLRRIESLRNQLQGANSNALRAYMDSTATNGGVLRIRELPFGEDRTANNVSDDLNDLKHSVYSVPAARERRIEVERILIDPITKDLHFSIGTVRQGEERVFKFPITNTSSLPLTIMAARSECDCIMPQTPEAPIAPGATGELELVYTGRTIPGPLLRKITITTDGTPDQLILIVEGTVVE